MASAAQLDRIAKSAAVVHATPIDDLVSNQSKWGPLNFELARKDLQLLFSLARHLQDLPVELIPEPNAEGIASALDRAATAVATIRTFDLQKSKNPSGEQAGMIQEVHDSTESLLVNTQGWIPFLAYQKGDIQRNIEEMSQAVGTARGLLSTAKTDIAGKVSELEKIISAAREASADAGVGVFTGDFSAQAVSNDAEAKNWLIATGVAAAVTLIVAVGAMFIKVGDSNAEIAQFLTSKILALVVLISATVWCGRLYKAAKHQGASNRHRAHALKTFQAFAQATDDESTRNAVLLETTRSIFGPTATGYLDSSEPATDAGTKILEIIKSSKSPG